MTFKRRKEGQSIIELAVGLLVLIPIVLVLFDLAIIILGVQMNDSTCREAARVAASGDPSTVTQRATSVVNSANARSAGILSNFQLISATTTVTPAQVTALQPYGGSLQGTVTVQTQVDVKPFVVQVVYSGHSPLQFRSVQTFPITYVVPNTVTSP